MSEQSAPALIDWDLAAATAARLAPAGPRLSPSEITVAVEDIRAKADASVDLVHRITGLEAARDLRDSQVLVVDRAGWSRANTQGFAVMMDPALKAFRERLAQGMSPTGARVGSALTGAQMGSVLAFLSSKVLGQYEPFSAYRTGGQGAGRAGRLLLVAPNIVEVERQLNVDTDDFRLWVCLHEQTHRVQFAAAPWLGDHMMEQIALLSDSFVENAGSFLERATRAVASLKEGGPEGGTGSLMELLQGPEQKAVMSRLTGIMSLLEGHANVVMDAVDSSVVPSVKTIRQRFGDRGRDRGILEKFFRRLLGLDAKMRQYTDGARFVRAVVERVGMDGFNRVWEGPENLPGEDEIHDPQAWMLRVGLLGGE